MSLFLKYVRWKAFVIFVDKNNILKYLLILFSLIFLAFGNADSQNLFGIEAGPDISNTVTKFGRSRSTSHVVGGAVAGIYGIIPVSQNFAFRPALRYQGKGGSVDAGDGNKIKTHLHYIGIIPDIVVRQELRNGGGSWFAGGGPFLDYGIASKQTTTLADVAGIDVFKSENMKRTDAGVNFIVGYELPGGLNFSFTGDIGLMNTSGHGNSDNFNRNKSFSLLIGYSFGRN